MSLNSRDKGKRGERELAKKLCEAGYEARRGQQFHGGADSPDVVGLDGIHIEVKRTERLQLYDAIHQAERDCGDKLPIVTHRKNGEEWVVVMRLNDWLSMYREWKNDNIRKP